MKLALLATIVAFGGSIAGFGLTAGASADDRRSPSSPRGAADGGRRRPRQGPRLPEGRGGREGRSGLARAASARRSAPKPSSTSSMKRRAPGSPQLWSTAPSPHMTSGTSSTRASARAAPAACARREQLLHRVDQAALGGGLLERLRRLGGHDLRPAPRSARCFSPHARMKPANASHGSSLLGERSRAPSSAMLLHVARRRAPRTSASFVGKWR